MNKSLYRPEVDGLRAIAVLSVLFYHVGMSVFSGGFVGVDVFFVISGYLITRLLRDEIESGRFSFSNFYIRRARRLFPAMFFTLAVSFVAAFVLFSPDHMERFSGALVYAVMSVSNFYFWQEADYFDVESDFKPLLHTWSLSVEEQFYMIWPLMLLFLLRGRNAWVAPASLVVLGCMSLVAAEAILERYPEAAFFLTPFRVVEFAVGGLVVWLDKYRERLAVLRELITLSGLVLIAYAVFVFDTETPFPGLTSLIPCLGTAMVIFAGESRSAKILLSNPAMLRIGLISYSLYLAHWPLYVFYRYLSFDALNATEMAAIVVGSIVIAELMYRYIETPFRRPPQEKNPLSPPAFGLLCAMLALVISLPAATAWSKDGWPWRESADIQEIVAIGDKVTKEDVVTWGLGTGCYIGGSFAPKMQHFPEDYDVRNCFGIDDEKANIMLIGDSTAAHLIHGLKQAYPEVRFIQVTAASCRPIFNWSSKHNCAAMVDFALNRYLPKYQNELDAIVFMGRWYGKEQTIGRLASTVSRVRAVTEKPIIVIGDQPELKSGLITLVSKYGRLSGLSEYLNSNRKPYEVESNPALEAMVKGKAHFYDFHDVLCENGCDFFIDGDWKRPITKDGNHYTPEGSIFVANKLREHGFLADYL